MDKPYSVTLEGIEDLPAAEKISAEVRFIKELEKGLGSAQDVAQVFNAWRDASECDLSELAKDTFSLAVKWPKAFETAQRAGLRNIGEGDAHFEVRLEKLV